MYRREGPIWCYLGYYGPAVLRKVTLSRFVCSPYIYIYIYIYIYRKPLQDKQGKYLATVCRSTGGWKLNKADQRGIIAASPPILISRARELAPSGHQSLSDDFSFAHVTRNIARLVLLATAFAAVSAFSRKSSWAGRDCVCVDAVQE